MKMICPKSETCKIKAGRKDAHCAEHEERTYECANGCLTLGCPACVEVKPKTEKR